MKYLLFLSLLISNAICGFSQSADSILILQAPYPWTVKLDAARLLHTIPSVQLSVSYRHSPRWEYESEFNYYLKYQNPTVPDRIVDPLLVSLDQSRLNFFVSGIAKRYVGRFYAGLRGAFGAANLNLERTICTKSAPSPSGEVCRCTEFETKQLDVKKSIGLFGLRLGIDLPITNRIKIDTYIDVAGFSSKPNTNYESLKHQTSCTGIPYIWRDIFYKKLSSKPTTDGILNDLIEEKSNLIYSLGLKLGYAF